MYQSGQMCEEPPNMLPSPSPSTSNLPDLAEPSHNSPCVLIAAIHDVLSHNKAKKKALTINDCALCFSALDSLDRLMDSSDHIEVSLKAFKAKLLGEISVLTPCSASYLSAAATTSLPQDQVVGVTVALDKDNNILVLTLPAIKAKVEAALVASGIEKLKGMELRGVKVLPRSCLLIAAISDRAASLLKETAAHWVLKIMKNSSLVVPRCQIMVGSVPTTLHPSSPSAKLALYSRNCPCFHDPSCIMEIRWINPKAVCNPNKKVSSLLITLSDSLSAALCISQGLTNESTICYPHRNQGTLSSTASRPPPRALTVLDPTAPPAALAPPAPPNAHKHPVYHKDCPVCIKECKLQSEHLHGRIFFEPNFDPYSSAHDDHTAPFFFNTIHDSLSPTLPPSSS
ncbi:hypothetical protein B0H14DRAFT_3496450 [Mycena olivaceomarginata]|nr:hypothetical protein B0H14DRAFT_3496450 [Mycena olivaceomarginata]